MSNPVEMEEQIQGPGAAQCDSDRPARYLTVDSKQCRIFFFGSVTLPKGLWPTILMPAKMPYLH